MNGTGRGTKPSAPPSAAPHEALWQSALADWDNASMHESLLSQCQTPAHLAALAGRYRGLLDDPLRKLVAEAQLKRIAAAAMARMEVSAPQRVTEPQGRTVLLILVALLFVAGTVALLRLL